MSEEKISVDAAMTILDAVAELNRRAKRIAELESALKVCIEAIDEHAKSGDMPSSNWRWFNEARRLVKARGGSND